MGYVRKDCFYIEIPLNWDTQAVNNCVAGLKLAGKGEFRFPNFVRIEFISRIVNRETRDGEFAQISFLSFLYALRVPSEALILRIAYKNDDLTGQAPMRDTALFGLRGPPSRNAW